MAQEIVYPGECHMCTWEETDSSALIWKVLKILIRSIWSNVSFKIGVSLLILSFDDLSIDDSGELKSPTIFVLLSISPLMPVSVCLMYWSVPMLGAYIFTIVISYCYIFFFVSYNILYFKVYFVWNKDCHSSCFLVSIHMEYLFPSFYFQSLCVSRYEVCLLSAAYIWVLVLYPFSESVSFGWCI